MGAQSARKAARHGAAPPALAPPAAAAGAAGGVRARLAKVLRRHVRLPLDIARALYQALRSARHAHALGQAAKDHGVCVRSRFGGRQPNGQLQRVGPALHLQRASAHNGPHRCVGAVLAIHAQLEAACAPRGRILVPPHAYPKLLTGLRNGSEGPAVKRHALQRAECAACGLGHAAQVHL